MTNIAEARRVIEQACGLGATDFCVCAGSRNAPLLAVLAGSDLRIYSFVDERAAAFFALGRAKLTGRPAAVVTTSGTAVAELLPAAIEAHYSGTPLILITADRPARYRGTGAPQSIEQEEIFGVYARGAVTHINVEFDEPLIDEEVVNWSAGVLAGWPGGVPPPTRQARNILPSTTAARTRAEPAGEDASAPVALRGKRPLIILGGLDSTDRPRVREFAIKLNAPIYAEPLSGLREDPALAHLVITAGERMIGRGDFDSVIRIGNVPTLRFWRDLDESRAHLPLISFSALPFTGCSRGEVHPLAALPLEVTPRDRDEAFFADDRERAASIAQILDGEQESELGMFRSLSKTIPQNARVYLGNSLPIREWDLAATRDPRGFEIAANRGANGIDGQISTFFGQCDESRANVCVVGDLTAIYDSNAPWIVQQLDAGMDWRIVIINNGGGRIFSRVPSLRKLDASMRARIIENAHAIRFDHWAAMWRIEDRVTELRPDAEASRRAWARYDALW
ncbi:MAG: 2-succinyl-5-enolpyruvyl-6-hydroxy-3-cyclohexene-1-carboxylate synthase [Acidobacteria bacterium]|nr:2-succinyl-5-enolpyruvyl-6-hydroxy-3-cyclohexene-1-carboxylate synthase [Acidobacteriota bacterium]MBV9071940.1 2-succinyl-5-enolpyruvyl-6-hydroxy-3-cyclohexene-1-carboxylate synthase [Acidobacteriota bacterium]MBV9185382.1 2-succinyl-5-enolpyruvyl-6-hydroxy-3-cyclohexene-1-carboxylate synthase [Acidobacteriota bacterium]